MHKRTLLRVVSPIVLSLVGAVLALALFHWLADEMLEGATLDFDEAVRAFVHRFASPVLTTVMSAISKFASLPTVLMGCVVACALLVWKQRRAPNHHRRTLSSLHILSVERRTRARCVPRIASRNIVTRHASACRPSSIHI